MTRTTFVNGRVLLPHGFAEDVSITMGHGRIASIGGGPSGDIVDLDGGILAPGFVDIQVNGGGDVMLNDQPDAEAMRQIADAHLRFGTTSLLPTLISDSLDKMRSVIDAYNAGEIPGVAGLHLEGPFLSPFKKGAHDEAYFRELDDDAFALLTSIGHGRMLVTLAPDVVPPETIARLTAAGVIVAAGHTAADYDQTSAALASGLAGFTHLFNAMPPVTGRAPGVIGAALESRIAWCGVIADNHHVHPASLRIAIAAKPAGKIVLVTDAMATVGGAKDSFMLNGEEIFCRDGRCVNAAGSLAGSNLDMATAVRNAVNDIGLDLADACRMASLYPARALRMNTEIGQIEPGYRADLVVLNEAIEVVMTVRGGTIFRF